LGELFLEVAFYFINIILSASTAYLGDRLKFKFNVLAWKRAEGEILGLEHLGMKIMKMKTINLYECNASHLTLNRRK